MAVVVVPEVVDDGFFVVVEVVEAVPLLELILLPITPRGGEELAEVDLLPKKEKSPPVLKESPPPEVERRVGVVEPLSNILERSMLCSAAAVVVEEVVLMTPGVVEELEVLSVGLARLSPLVVVVVELLLLLYNTEGW